MATKQRLGERHGGGVALATFGTEVARVPLAEIRVNGGTQMRAGLNPETVSEYAAAMREYNGWGKFEPVEVYHDGSTYWLADGFHRVAAAKEAGIEFAEAKVHAGDQRKAILHAAGANADHGLRRTNADKRRAVEALLRDGEWQGWSDSAIAKACKVDPKTVASVRQELVSTMEIHSETERKTADGRTMNTANIGAKPREVKPLPPRHEPPELKPAMVVYDKQVEATPEPRQEIIPALALTSYDAKFAPLEEAGFALERTRAGDRFRWVMFATAQDDIPVAVGEWVRFPFFAIEAAMEFWSRGETENPRHSLVYRTLIEPDTSLQDFNAWMDSATKNQLVAVFEDWPIAQRGNKRDRAIQAKLQLLGVTELVRGEGSATDEAQEPTPEQRQWQAEMEADELAAMAEVAAEQAEEDAERAERDAQRGPGEAVPEVTTHVAPHDLASAGVTLHHIRGYGWRFEWHKVGSVFVSTAFAAYVDAERAAREMVAAEAEGEVTSGGNETVTITLKRTTAEKLHAATLVFALRQHLTMVETMELGDALKEALYGEG